jgi:thiamine-phosphate pyrophosphorylase
MPAAAIDRLRGLYAITPDTSDTARLVALVEAAIAGGASAIQYRNKSASFALREQQASELAGVARMRGALFIVNDDIDVAALVGADGVHIGEHDGDIAGARAMLERDQIIGVSCYDDLERARKALTRGANYVAFGSFFASRVKPGARHADVSLIRAAKKLGAPVVAIGGITAANARELVNAGVDAVAVISDVFDHDDLDAVTRAAAAIAACFRKV